MLGHLSVNPISQNVMYSLQYTTEVLLACSIFYTPPIGCMNYLVGVLHGIYCISYLKTRINNGTRLICHLLQYFLMYFLVQRFVYTSCLLVNMFTQLCKIRFTCVICFAHPSSCFLFNIPPAFFQPCSRMMKRTLILFSRFAFKIK